MGTRRLNLSSFCVLPSIQAIPLRQADDSRFGIQGTTFVESGKILVGDPYTLYPMLGVKWVNYNARWDLNEGMQAGQYKPVDNAPHGETAYAAERGLSLLTCSEGVPRWAMDVPANDAGQVNLDNQAYPPKDINAFERYLEAVATHQDKMRRDFFPAMSRNWYQLSWEPDWHFKGTPQQYVDMCAHASAAIHRGDPTARVMATGGGILAKTVEWLRIMLPMGLGKSIDGIATHAYYDNDGNPFRAPMPGLACAPEDGRVIANMRELKALAHRYLRPGARIMQTEWCMEYKGSYSTLSPELLRRHAAHIVRGHIILLGEGADTTFLFYTSEGEGEAGGGFTFNLIDGLSGCGAVDMSPKPEFPACAAMTRVLEGTKTIGPLTGLPADCYGYAFDRAGKTVVAVWKAHPGPAKVSLPLAGPKCEIIDFMGNSTSRGARNCNIKLDVCEYPVYVLGVESRRLSR